MGFRSQFRGVKEWSDTTNGTIKLTTISEDAAKWYDASLTQLVGWYEDDSFGGLETTVKLMLEADPNFKLGRIFELELNLMGGLSSPHINKDLRGKLVRLEELVAKEEFVSSQEKLHYEVLLEWSNGDLKSTTRKLEKLATMFPEDLLALKMLQEMYFMLGTAPPMRNSIAYAVAKMSDKNPLKGYAHGMYSFALEESNMYPAAQLEATKALSLIPRDTWAIHNYAHCLEMQGKPEDGLSWMEDRKCDWLPCSMLACHQFWHTALFHINNNHFDEAVAILDDEILPRCNSNCTSLDLVDGASMIYRMEMVDLFNKVQGPKTNLREDCLKRWSGVYGICEPHLEDHIWGFNDAHYMMSYLGSENVSQAERSLETLRASSYTSSLAGKTTESLLDGMRHFKLGNYSTCVGLLTDIRFDLVNIGGSHAQRDIFDQLLLVAALKSQDPEHNKLAERMLIERDTFHGRRLPQTELLAQQGINQ